MQWRKIEQYDPEPGQNSIFINRLSVDIYGNFMLVLKNELEGGCDRLYCCDRRKPFLFYLTVFLLDTLDSWSSLDVRGLGGIKMIGNSVIYRNLFYVALTTDKERKNIKLASFVLESKELRSLLLKIIRTRFDSFPRIC